MTRDEFLAAMERELTRLKVSDRAEAMEYYIEYFAEAGPENEQKVIAELGSPERIAAQIRAQAILKDAQEDPQNGKKNWRALWAAIGGFFAILIVSPLGLGIAVVCLALVLVVLLLFGIFFLVSVLFGLLGVLLMVLSFTVWTQGPLGVLSLIGAGLALIGLGGMFFIPTLLLFRSCLRGISSLLGKIAQKKHPTVSGNPDIH